MEVALWADDHKNIIFSIDKEELKYNILTLGNVLIDTKRGILDSDLFSDYLDKIRYVQKVDFRGGTTDWDKNDLPFL